MFIPLLVVARMNGGLVTSPPFRALFNYVHIIAHRIVFMQWTFVKSYDQSTETQIPANRRLQCQHQLRRWNLHGESLPS